MDAQLNLFPHPEHSPAQAVCALSVEEGLGIEEGGSMSKSRGQTRPSEAEPTGGLQPHLTTTHGLLYQADCLDFLATVRSESIATVFADPPFNLQKEYKNGFKDKWEDGDYLDWWRSAASACAGAARCPQKPSGFFTGGETNYQGGYAW